MKRMARSLLSLIWVSLFWVSAPARAEPSPVDLARERLLSDEPQAAIRLLETVLDGEEADPREKASALEYLGVAFERAQNLDKAAVLYQRYLDTYANSPGVTRVRQRLLALQEIQPVARPRDRKLRLDVALGQDYWRDRWLLTDTNEVDANSGLLTNLFIDGRYAGRNVTVGTRVSLDHLLTLDSISAEADAGAEWRVALATVDVADRAGRWRVSAGRQSRFRDGVQGRFTGVAASYRLREGLQARVTTGLAVDGPRFAADGDRPFVAAAIEATRHRARASLFAYSARSDGLVDRRGIGSELGLALGRVRVRGLVDFDLAYSELNAAFLQTHVALNQRLRGYARGHAYAWPRYSVRNALVASAVQPIPSTSLDILSEQFSAAQIRALARANTGDARTLQSGFTWRVSQRHSLIGDVQYLRLIARRDDAPIDEQQVVYRLDLQSAGVLRRGDQWRTSGGVINALRGDDLFLSVQSRLPLGRGLRVGPTLEARYRLRGSDTDEATRLIPGVRVDWRVRRFSLRLDVQRDWQWQEPVDALPGVTEETHGWTALLSWRWET